MTNPQDPIARLRVIQSQFERIAAKHPNDQPSYSDGVRPFGIGDLRHFIETLEIAAAALTVPNHSSVGREELARIATEIDNAGPHATVICVTVSDAKAILALLPTAPAGVSEDGK